MFERDDDVGLDRHGFLCRGVFVERIVFAGERIEVEDDVEGFVDDFFCGSIGSADRSFVAGDEVVPVLFHHDFGEFVGIGRRVAELEVEAVAEVGGADTGGFAGAEFFPDHFSIVEKGVAVESGVFDGAGEVTAFVDRAYEVGDEVDVLGGDFDLHLSEETIPERVGGGGVVEPVQGLVIVGEGALEFVVAAGGFEFSGGDGFENVLEAKRFFEIVDSLKSGVFLKFDTDGLF